MQQRRVLAGAGRAVMSVTRCIKPLGCCEGVIERAEGRARHCRRADADLAILSCVGRPVCFHVLGFFPDGRRSCLAAAQELDLAAPAAAGDILPAVVTGLAEFGVLRHWLRGAGAVSARTHLHVASGARGGLPAVGQRIFTAVRTLDPVQRRVTLTMRELLGTAGKRRALPRPANGDGGRPRN